jgi:hypothetical protein
VSVIPLQKRTRELFTTKDAKEKKINFEILDKNMDESKRER